MTTVWMLDHVDLHCDPVDFLLLAMMVRNGTSVFRGSMPHWYETLGSCEKGLQPCLCGSPGASGCPRCETVPDEMNIRDPVQLGSTYFYSATTGMEHPATEAVHLSVPDGGDVP